MITKEILSVNYAITVGADRLLEIIRHDDEVFTYEETLNARLDCIEGVNDTNYDGHFGPYVFIRLDVENDTPETWEEIEQLIT